MIEPTFQTMTNRDVFSSKVVSFFPAVALFVIAFAPALLFDFGFHNDYSIWSYNHHQCCLGFPETQHLFWVGRPIGALLLNLHFMWFDSISSLAWGRGFSLLFLLGALVLTTVNFERAADLTRPTALSLATLIFLLPSSLLYVLWLSNFVPGILNVLIVSIAYFFVEKAYSRPSLLERRQLACLGYGTLFFSLFIYPATSYFFLAFTLAKVIFKQADSWRHARRQVVAELVGCAVASILFFLSIKFFTPVVVQTLFGQAATRPASGAYAVEVAQSVSTRIPVIRDVAQVAGRLWFDGFVPESFYTYATSILFLAGLASWARKRVVRFTLGALERAGFILILLAASATPMIAASGGFVATRNIFALSAMLVIGLVGVVVCILNGFKLSGRTPAVMFILCAFAAVVASVRITAVAYNANAELEFIRRQVAKFDKSVRSIIVLRPPLHDVIGQGPLTGDFVAMATNGAMVDKGIIRIAMTERGLRGNAAEITDVLPEAGAHLAPVGLGTITRIIDMPQAGFRNALCGPHPHLETNGTVSMLSSDCHSPVSAWDQGRRQDLAVGKSATQSSTFAVDYQADKAVDGITDGDAADGSISHTGSDPNAWWQVDLGTSTAISSIRIWNRIDCCGERLSDYWVFVSESPFDATDTPSKLRKQRNIWGSRQTVAPSPSADISVKALGRYIRIQLTGQGYLSLAEVQVTGEVRAK